jgi:hypothetical protein
MHFKSVSLLISSSKPCFVACPSPNRIGVCRFHRPDSLVINVFVSASAVFSAVFALILLGAEVKLVEPNSFVAIIELAFCVAFLVVGTVISFRDLRGYSQ